MMLDVVRYSLADIGPTSMIKIILGFEWTIPLKNVLKMSNRISG